MKFLVAIVLFAFIATSFAQTFVLHERRGPQCQGRSIGSTVHPLGCVSNLNSSISTKYECNGKAVTVTKYNGTTCQGTPYNVLTPPSCDAEEGEVWTCSSFPSSLTSKDAVYVYYRTRGCPRSATPSSFAIYPGYAKDCKVGGGMQQLNGTCIARLTGSSSGYCGRGFNFIKFMPGYTSSYTRSRTRPTRTRSTTKPTTTKN
eukprot:TRINITY_DN406_c0_g1_i1.p1 TRINITY_DN406_c0_g1~~TRINITY_DN406_c0_g1_i1.p1  ORF type:complete len:202 (+),score=65.13 TRINITY_DN406_c0_g1_i1:53-658(+)